MPGSSLVQANYLLMKHIKKDCSFCSASQFFSRMGRSCQTKMDQASVLALEAPCFNQGRPKGRAGLSTLDQTLNSTSQLKFTPGCFFPKKDRGMMNMAVTRLQLLLHLYFSRKHNKTSFDQMKRKWHFYIPDLQ